MHRDIVVWKKCLCHKFLTLCGSNDTIFLHQVQFETREKAQKDEKAV